MSEKRPRVVARVISDLNELKILHVHSQASSLLEALAEREYDKWMERHYLARGQQLEWPAYESLSEDDKHANRLIAVETLEIIIRYVRDGFFQGESTL